jgi:hypothetical protein
LIRRPVAGLLGAAVFAASVLSIAGSITQNTSAAASPMTWSLANDFRAAPHETNTSPDNYGSLGVWSYMQSASDSHDPTTYTLLQEPTPPPPNPLNFQTNEAGVGGLEDWYGPNCPASPSDCFPHIGRNTTGSDQRTNWVTVQCIRKPFYPPCQRYATILWPAGTMLMHPYTTQMAVVGWTSPVDATVTMSASFQNAELINCGNGIAWTIDKPIDTHDVITLASGQALPLQAAVSASIHSVRVQAGQTFYLTIDAQQNYYCDSTLTSWTITTS